MHTKQSTTLILGATGQTGRRVAQQLLEKDQAKVHVIVRSKDRFLSDEIIAPYANSPNLEIKEATLLDMDEEEAKSIVKQCDSVVMCLGHNMTMKGMFGHPRTFVADTTKLVYKLIQELQQDDEGRKNSSSPSSKHIKFILMSSDGVANPIGSDDKRTAFERFVLGCLRACLPPVKDQEMAAKFLSDEIQNASKSDNNHHQSVQWVAVRPSDLLEGDVSKYEVFDKPKPGLFGSNCTTRANVAHFMCDLVMNQDLWNKWVHQMPVPINIPSSETSS